MINLITGTIRNTIKLAEMDQKWQQKKEETGKKEFAEMDPQSRQIALYQEDMRKIRENRQKEALNNKLKAGEGLTPEEIDYLKKHDPKAYQEYLEVKQEKAAYEKRLKACKTKEDVEKLKLHKMGHFMAEAKSIANNPNIPKEKKLELMEKLLKKVTGVQKKHMDYTASAQYQKLPTQEEAEKKRRKPEQTEQQDQPDGAQENAELPLPELIEKAEKAYEEVKRELTPEGSEKIILK